jgi:hypothetical protein
MPAAAGAAQSALKACESEALPSQQVGVIIERLAVMDEDQLLFVRVPTQQLEPLYAERRFCSAASSSCSGPKAKSREKPAGLQGRAGEQRGALFWWGIIWSAAGSRSAIAARTVKFRHQVARLEPGTLGRRLRVDLEDGPSSAALPVARDRQTRRDGTAR